MKQAICLNGHLRTPDNVDANRRCKKCQRESDRRRASDPNNFSCGHPRTPDNSYQHPHGQICRRCSLARSNDQHRRKKTGERPPVKRLRDFCAPCEAGTCSHAGGCFRQVSKSENALACRCGVAWAITWKHELRSHYNETALHRGGLG